jgi:acyl-CoA synthetase (AMP-forming)/AMP-acid ligase II
MTTQPKNLLDILEERSAENPAAVQFRFLHSGDLDGSVEELTRRQVLERASALGALLAEQTRPGDRILLLYPPGLETFVAFLACVHADTIAVPMAPPDPGRMHQTLPRLLSIVEQSGASLVLSTSAVVEMAQPFLAEIPAMANLRWMATDEAFSTAWSVPIANRRSGRKPHAIAFLQYTSGSLGTPKGVMVTDAALLANLEMIRVGMCLSASTPNVTWLPHFHDMGFIGGALEHVYTGAPTTLMSPMAFIQKPVRWLRAISRYRGFVCGGPCFGYDRCVSRISDAELEGLDLSSWEVAFIGAEPVRAPVLERFARRFERCGFRREAFYPCYGLAESTLYVTGKPMAGPLAVPRQLEVSADALEQHRVEHRKTGDGRDGAVRTLMSCGTARLEADVAIVSREHQARVKPGEVGEIWVRGPNIAVGYWNDEEKTKAGFGNYLSNGEGPFLATGDLGFIEDGELFVTGRLKELLIIGGRNHYPQDLEETIEASHPDLRRGGSAAFSYEGQDDEVLTIVAEIAPERISSEQAAPSARPYQDVVNAIRAALLKHHFVIPKEIAFLPPSSLAKTTSGKKARLDMRRRFLSGELERV